MSHPPRRRPPWVGFMIGLLAVALPLGGFLLYQYVTKEDTGSPSLPPAEATRPQADRPAATGTGPVAPPASFPGTRSEPFPIDDATLQAAGASLPDLIPRPDPGQIREALARIEEWLGRRSIDPFGGSGIDSLRLFALEVECWERLWKAESDPERKRALGEETRKRLLRFVDPDRLTERLRRRGSLEGVLEILILSGHCRAHGIDPSPLIPLLQSISEPLDAALPRMPPAMAALYVAQLTPLSVDVGGPLDRYRMEGHLSDRPREVTIDLSTAFALTQEIFAYTDLASRPLEPNSPGERRYIERVLPHLAMTYTLLQNLELSADLLSCLALADLTETYGYREGMRVLLTRQNRDGSFGAAGAEADWMARLAVTTSCATALSLDLVQRRGWK